MTLVLESLSVLLDFIKQSSKYLFNITPVPSRSYLTRYVEIVSSFKMIHNFFKNSFLKAPTSALMILNNNYKNI